MKKSRYTDEQIAYALCQAELGTPVAEAVPKMGVSDQTFRSETKSFRDISAPKGFPFDTKARTYFADATIPATWACVNRPAERFPCISSEPRRSVYFFLGRVLPGGLGDSPKAREWNSSDAGRCSATYSQPWPPG